MRHFSSYMFSDDSTSRTPLSSVSTWRSALTALRTLDIAPLRSESSPQKRSDMARVLEGSHSFTFTPNRPHSE